MSATKTFEVKIQLKGGTSIITIVHAESDFRARQLIKIEWEGKMANIHYVREIR